ncbi:hypothetical protein D1007_50096 [Hordeum vulgare]|nr:hypothetical protein D1007_50096 [Hordeum vulgare]
MGSAVSERVSKQSMDAPSSKTWQLLRSTAVQDMWEGVTTLKIRLILSFQIDHIYVVNTSMNMGLDQACLAVAIQPNHSPSVAQVNPTEVQHV